MDPEVQKLVITGGEGDLAKALIAEFENASWTVEAPGRTCLDVTSPSTIRSYFSSRDVDLLICNAGMVRDALLARLNPDGWEDVWKANYRGALDCAREALPGMTNRGSGHVVFLSSHSALHPPLGQAAYAAAKAALLGLTVDLARQYGPSGIRVNCILPGFLETRMTSTLTDQRRRDVLAEHALGRFNTPCHAARFIRFLHEDLPHTSGQCFQLDSRARQP